MSIRQQVRMQKGFIIARLFAKGVSDDSIRATHAQEGDVIGLLFPMGLAHAGISYDPSQTDNNSVSASSKSPSVGVCGEVDYFQHEAKIHCTERVCSGAFSICANVEPHDGKGFHGVASHALWSQLLASSQREGVSFGAIGCQNDNVLHGRSSLHHHCAPFVVLLSGFWCFLSKPIFQ